MPSPPPRKPSSRIRIEDVRPVVDCGRFPAKRTVGERLTVSAEVFRDGHEILGAAVRYRKAGKRAWLTAPMEPLVEDLDRYEGSFAVTECGRWQFAVEAWHDRQASWRDELRRKVEGGQEDLASELIEGAAILGTGALDVETALASTATGKDDLAALERPLELEADRELARFGAWYELFPRSFGGFKGVEKVLPQLVALGFDVLYFPPIHPIGESGRKGANNTLPAKMDDPGSPWAIGGKEGGHTAVHPDLGTLADFDRLVAQAADAGIEIALDYAIQCSPDHPWLKEHPEWFQHRPDGTIKYAENPPKKYQDIVNVDFECEDWQGLWAALRDIVLFWIDHGVRIFRVDNPHTKPLPFWEWMIGDVRSEYPDTVFLAEAFTRPAMMRALAKVGFNQSYTYFTWKNTRAELTEFVEEFLETADYYRPNCFVNTPDILHEYLQVGGRAAFEARLVLAATLSPSYGVYSGYERLENVPVRPGSEEYLNSEKYELKQRRIEGPLLPLIQRLNEIRRGNRCLQHIDNITFLDTESEFLIAYAKQSESDTVIVCVNLDPFSSRDGLAIVPVTLGLADAYMVQDLLSDQSYAWGTGRNYVQLAPGQAHVMHVR